MTGHDAQRASRVASMSTKPCCRQLARLARVRAHGRARWRRRRQVVGRGQVAAGGARVASWPSVWPVGSTGLAGGRRVGRGRRGDHEHRRARLARHALAVLSRSDGGEAARP